MSCVAAGFFTRARHWTHIYFPKAEQQKMAIYERSGKWAYRFTVEGVRYGETTDLAATTRNRKRAEAIESGERHKARHEGLARVRVKSGFSALADRFAQHVRSEYSRPETARRIIGSLSSLREYFKDIDVSRVTPADVDAYKAWRRENGIAEVTLRHDCHNLSLYFRYAIKQGAATENPVDEVKIPSDKDAVRMRILTEVEEAQYFAQLEEGSNLYDAARLMVLQGMRPTEVLTLQRRHVDLDAGTVRIEQGKTPAARRVVYLRGESLDIVRRRMESKQESKWLFPSAPMKRIKRDIPVSNLRMSHDRAARDCGIEFRLYDLRHTFATRAGQSGVDLITLAALLGHEKHSILTRYYHPTAEHQKRAIGAMDNETTEAERTDEKKTKDTVLDLEV